MAEPSRERENSLPRAAAKSFLISTPVCWGRSPSDFSVDASGCVSGRHGEGVADTVGEARHNNRRSAAAGATVTRVRGHGVPGNERSAVGYRRGERDRRLPVAGTGDGRQGSGGDGDTGFRSYRWDRLRVHIIADEHPVYRGDTFEVTQLDGRLIITRGPVSAGPDVRIVDLKLDGGIGHLDFRRVVLVKAVRRSESSLRSAILIVGKKHLTVIPAGTDGIAHAYAICEAQPGIP